jgi:thiol-disulfide isomerase/thioredoxin
MKKIIASLVFASLTVTAFCQTDTIQHPYLKFPTYPPVQLLLPDSVSLYNKTDLPKKMPVMVMVFNPECGHCQIATETIVQNIDKFKNIQIVMATSAPFSQMLTFREKYKLDQYENIVVTHDANFFLTSFYMLHNLPFFAFYNKKKELISAGESSMTVEKILAAFNMQ